MLQVIPFVKHAKAGRIITKTKSLVEYTVNLPVISNQQSDESEIVNSAIEHQEPTAALLYTPNPFRGSD